MSATPRSTRTRYRQRLRPRDRNHRGAHRRARGHLDLSRRRHAVADAAGDRRRHSRCDRPALARCAGDVEVTLEANPTSVEATRFRGYRAAGVNRVSLGVQALDDASLKSLGRMHTAHEAMEAVGIARTDLRSLLVRPDLCPARTRRRRCGPRNCGARSRKPPSICRSISSPSSRRRRSSACTPPASCATPDEDTGRALYDVTQEVCAAGAACRPMRFPTTPGPARSAGTIWSIGAARNMPASAPARMAGSISAAAATPPPPRSGRKPG